MAVNTVQTSFRIRTDATAAQGGAPVWAAAQNTNVIPQTGVPFRIRFAISNTGTSDVNFPAIWIWYSKNGAAYTVVPGSASDIASTDATGGASADGSSITTGLLTGAGTFSGAGAYFRTQGTSFGPSVTGGTYVEYEFGLQLTPPGCDGNLYTFHVVFNNSPLNTYTVTPSFNMPNRSALSATEAADVITAAGNVPRAAALSVVEVGDSLTGAALATNRATLVQTEADDALTGIALIANRGILAATEAADTLTGVAIGPATGVLAATEANDALTGTAFQAAVGSITGVLTTAEANDALTGLGSVVGVVGSMILIESNDALASAGVRSSLEDSDVLTGFAGLPLGAMLNATEANDVLASATLSGVNQWFPIPPPSGIWFEVGPNG